jgi:hypothetical protein
MDATARQRRIHCRGLGAAFLAVVLETAGVSGCTQGSDEDGDGHSDTASVGQEMDVRLDPAWVRGSWQVWAGSPVAA